MNWWMFLIYLIANYWSIYAILVFVSTLFDEFRWNVFSKKGYYYALAIFTILVVTNASLIKFYSILPWTFVMLNELALIGLVGSYVYIRFRTTWHVPLVVVSIYWVVSMMFEIPVSLLINMYIPVEEFMSIQVQLTGTIYMTLCFLFAAGLVSMVQRKIHFRLSIPSSIISYVIMVPIVLVVLYNVVFAKLYTSEEGGLVVISFLLLCTCLILLMLYLWLYHRKRAS